MAVDLRFKRMIKILSAYAGGDFASRLKISPRYDELDAIAESINMLGQELKAITISRNYFNNIFHSVSDMIFVLDRSGKIMDTNKKVYGQLGYQKEFMLHKKLDEFAAPGKNPLTRDILRELRQREGRIYKDYYFKTAGRTRLPVRISASYLVDDKGKKSSILLIAEDRTSQIENENRVIRAIIDTQENEQRRLAKDLHDSLGQELIGVRFSISSISENCGKKREKKILQQSDDALNKIIKDMRDICFNLLPKALDEFGLLKAVRELCLHTEKINKITCNIQADETFPEPSKQVATDLFRVIQEFISNAIRHGQGSYISLCFKSHKNRIFISLKDNGCGFSKDKVTKGMGLQNIESRIKSHNGEVAFDSSPGKGTHFQIMLPLSI